jgi:hypothetical protein
MQPQRRGFVVNTKTRTNPKNASSATDSRIITAGKIFVDGTMIELVAAPPGQQRPNLLLWNGRKATVGPRVKHGDRIYEAPVLDPTLSAGMRLPTCCCDYGSARNLFAGIRDLFQRHLGLPKPDSALIACFVLSTWLCDRLPSAPTLAISGPNEQLGIELLRLLHCVCRHPLILADLTPGSFRSLPMHLSLTLLLDQAMLKFPMQRVLYASSQRGLHLPGTAGRVLDVYGPKAIFSSHILFGASDGDALHVSLAPSRLPLATIRKQSELSEPVQQGIANYFQPRLLMYRLKNFPKVHDGHLDLDLSQFTVATCQLACNLARCFPGDAELRSEAVQLLQAQDEEVREQRSRDVDYVIIEILWRLLHNRERQVIVDQITKGVNALLATRGEIFSYRRESIGWRLRDLRIVRHDASSGQQVFFDRDTSKIVHRLARAYDLACAQNVDGDCPDCKTMQVPIAK